MLLHQGLAARVLHLVLVRLRVPRVRASHRMCASQNLASTLWAYTTAEARDWGVLLDAAVDCLRGKPSWHFRGQPQSIVHVLWALTKHDRKEAE